MVNYRQSSHDNYQLHGSVEIRKETKGIVDKKNREIRERKRRNHL